MDQSVIFARHFAQLIWLLLHEPTNIGEQKVALRALVILSKSGDATISLSGDALQINGETVPVALTGATDVAKQMKLHGIAMISIDVNAAPAHVLGVARILAGMPTLNDGGSAAEAQRVALGATTVRFAANPRASQSVAPSDMDFGDVLDDPLGEAVAKGAPRSPKEVASSSSSHNERGGMFAQFATPNTPRESHESLLAKLGVATDPAVIVNLLDDLLVIAELAATERKSAVVVEIMAQMLRREAKVSSAEAKRILQLSLRRLSKPEHLRCVVTQLALHPAGREQYVALLTRAGESGADALIEQLGAVEHQRDRHIYFGVLAQLNAGVTSLLHMLSDAQWFVVRNAAEVLGEMQAREAEKPLSDLLRHSDDRVRRAARGALMRLGTAHAMQAIQAGLADSAPDLRADAAAALVTRKDARSTGMLLQAIESEKDEQVQAAFLLSLGKLATPEAVQRLIKEAEAERGFFKRKSTAYRVASVHGLSEANTSEAMDALRALQADKEAEVREAAKGAIARITRRSTIERPAIS
ncbi:MAG: HEAT repeat domain-containing protein [bacterium]